MFITLGVGLMTWSPISFGLSLGEKDDNTELFEKLSIKVRKISQDLQKVAKKGT